MRFLQLKIGAAGVRGPGLLREGVGGFPGPEGSMEFLDEWFIRDVK